MKTVAFLFFSVASSMLCAQRMDTTEVKNGMYGVFQSNKRGFPVSPVAVYDTTDRLRRHESYRHGHLHGPVIYYDSAGTKTRMVTYKKGKKNGREILYYPDGSVQVDVHNRNGVNHGRSTSYYQNGRVEWTKGYRDGKLHGERILRDSTGALYNGEYLTVFRSGARYLSVCTNGRPHGKLTMLRPSGEVSYTGNYTNGFPDGEFLYFDNEGEVWRKEYYIMGKFERSTQRGNNGGPVTTDDP